MKKISLLFTILLIVLFLYSCNNINATTHTYEEHINNPKKYTEYINENNECKYCEYMRTHSHNFENGICLCGVREQHDDEYYDNLTEIEAFKLIKEDYYNIYCFKDNYYSREDVLINLYYGNYNGSYVVKIKLGLDSGVGWFVITTINIDGILINFPTTNTAVVWNNGNFYTLKEAYEKDKLSKEDLQTIANICNEQSKMPEEMPNDFSFSVKWSFDGTYDSKTNILSNGYNYDLNTECKTKLFLSNDQLKEIYDICKKNKIDIYNGVIQTREYEILPNCNLILKITVNNQEYEITLCNSYLSDNFEEYIAGKKVANAIKEITEKYIINSDSYKNLPPNQQLYD